MSQVELNVIKCNNIKTNFNESGMTAGEFWDAFADYCGRESDKICSRRVRRYSVYQKIADVICSVSAIAGTVSVLIMAAIH